MNSSLLKSHKTFYGLTQFWEHDSYFTKTKMKFSTFIPSNEVKGCIVWLSGLTCTEENFISKAGAQKYLAESGLMVICPDTSPRGLNLPGEHESYDFGSGASFYVNATTPGYKDHYQMESYIASELYELIQIQFGISPHTISISGHSMGGHGALILGLKHEKKFRSVSAFSPIVNPVECAWGQKAFQGYFGDVNVLWAQNDATELIKNGSRHQHKILIDQGSKDEFLEKQLLTDHLVKACQSAEQSIEVHYRDDYDHSYYFVSTFIESHIQFHAKAMNA